MTGIEGLLAVPRHCLERDGYDLRAVAPFLRAGCGQLSETYEG